MTDTRWLRKGKAPGEWKRAEQGDEGEPLRLEATVNGAAAPDGTPAAFQIFQQGRDGTDLDLGAIAGKIENAKSFAEWICVCRPHVDPTQSSPLLYFRVTVKDDAARSTLLPVESFVDFTVEDQAGAPVAEMDYALKLPHGREKRGRTGKDGRLRQPSPPGQAFVTLLPASGSFLEFTCLDEDGKPYKCAYAVVLAYGSERRGTTDERGRARLEGVPDGEYEVRIG